MARKPNKLTIVRRLFALSGNQCAFLDCVHELINAKGQFVAEICHIEGANPGSARFKATQSDEDRRAFENLLLLCHKHHIETDDEKEFDVPRMQKIKADHEQSFTSKNQYSIPKDIEDRIIGEINSKLDTLLAISVDTNTMVGENTVLTSKVLEAVLGLSKGISPSPEKQDDSAIYAKQLEFIKDLKKEGKYATALDLLQKYKTENWDNLNNELKFKTVANIVVLYLNLHNKPEAIQWMQSLQEIDYEHPDRYAYLSLSYGLQRDQLNFEKYFAKAQELGSDNSNVWLGYIHAHPGMDPDELIRNIPESQLQKSEVIFTLADRYYTKGRIAEGDAQMDSAARVEKDSPLMTADIKAFAATKSLPVLLTQFKEFQHQYSAGELELLRKTLTNLTESWDILKTTELAASRWHVVLNRGVLHKLLGNTQEAAADFLEAFNLSHAYLPLKNLVLALLLDNKTSDATKAIDEFLERNPDQSVEQRGEIVLMRSRILLMDGKFDEAIAALETLLTDEFRMYRKRTLLTITHNCFEKGEVKKAEPFCAMLLQEYPQDIESLSVNAHLQSLNGNTTEAVSLLDSASSLITQHTNPQLIFEIAIDYFDIKAFEKARPLLERIADTNIINGVTRALILSYFNLSDTETALQIAEPLFNVNQANDFLAEIVIKCHEDAGEYTKAIGAAEIYINNPNAGKKNQFRFHTATICFHIKQHEKMNALLQAIDNFSQFQQDASYRIAYMLATGGQTDKALELAYQTRSKYYDDSKAHLAYLQVLNSIQRSEEDLFPADVQMDSGVELEDTEQSLYRYLISEQPVRAENLVTPDTDIAQCLIGKQKGEKVSIDRGFGLHKEFTIKNIFNKYTYAYQETVNLFSTRFVGQQNVTVMKVGKENPLQEIEQMVRTQALEKAQHEKQVLEHYRSRQIPLSTVAMLFKENFVKQWGNLLSNQDFFQIAFLGNHANALANTLEQQKPVVLDMTVLLASALVLQSYNLLERMEVPLYVAQSTLEEIQQFHDELDQYTEKGRLSLTYQNGQVVSTMIEKEQVIDYQQKLGTLIQWCTTKTTVIAPAAKSGISREERSTRIDAIGKSCYDTVALAEQLQAAVLSDDAVVVTSLLPMSNVVGFSTFDVALNMKARGLVGNADFDEIYHKLIGANYISLPGTPEQVWDAFDKAQFQIRKPFTTAAKTFSILLPAFASQYAAQFLKRVYTEITVDAMRTPLTLYVFSELLSRPDSKKIAEILVLFIVSEFRLLPIQLVEVLQLLDSMFDSGTSES
jgi:tetratricopeptide (TPR) repeat protein